MVPEWIVIFPLQQANLIVGHFPRKLSDEEGQNFLSACIEWPSRACRKNSGAILAQHVDNIAKNRKHILLWFAVFHIALKRKKNGAHGDCEAFTKYKVVWISIDADWISPNSNQPAYKICWKSEFSKMGPYLMQQKAISLWENGRLSNEQMQLKKEQRKCHN